MDLLVEDRDLERCTSNYSFRVQRYSHTHTYTSFETFWHRKYVGPSPGPGKGRRGYVARRECRESLMKLSLVCMFCCLQPYGFSFGDQYRNNMSISSR